MKESNPHILDRALRALSAAALACACLALFPACKGNTTSAAQTERVIPAPPIVSAVFAADEPGQAPATADPLSADVWQHAHWTTFTAPANTTRTTAPTRSAILFDASTLYIAVVSGLQPPSGVNITRDAVSLFLDTTAEADGREMVKISVDSSGQAAATWIRSALPAQRREDGSPDLRHPFSTIPDIKIAGLSAHVGQATENGVPVWTAVIALPLKALPIPLRASPVAGAHWKFNVLRTVTISGEHKELLQSNLSAVHVGAQEFAPYRMADLAFTQ